MIAFLALPSDLSREATAPASRRASRSGWIPKPSRTTWIRVLFRSHLSGEWEALRIPGVYRRRAQMHVHSDGQRQRLPLNSRGVDAGL